MSDTQSSPPPSISPHSSGVVALPIPGAKTATALSALHDRALEARSLLFYAAEAGIEVKCDDDRRDILRAVDDIGAFSSPEAAAALLAGITRLTHALSPVTAASLAACNGHAAQDAVRGYRRWAIVLAIIIIPMSLVTFVTSAISEATLKDITDANALAVKLTDEESSPKTRAQLDAQGEPDKLPREINVIRDLQMLAGTTRAVDARARQLNWFVAGIVDDPFAAQRKEGPAQMQKQFDLPAGLPNLSKALRDRISTYQLIRQFAQSTREAISTAYGAIAAGILPILYALLGAVACLLRSYQQQFKDRTFTAADSHVARFVIAAIGGGIVGLFTNFTSGNGGASISPLAIAFLVGYATDVFFSFLDSFVQTFNRGGTMSPSESPKVGK